ncbi:MAG: type IVB secretion system lipoprotein DotD [Proteobacteria bacterium]|nr:type IVB secretion system lipoprotein DotD [Pseudomonadota bacterium]
MNIKNFFFLASATLVLAGCSTTVKHEVNLHYVAADQAPAEMNNQDAQVQLAEAASSVGKSLQQLSAMQMSVTPEVKLPEIDAKTTGMTQVTSLDWYGPVLPLLEQIGKATGYKIQVLGQTPSIPVMVAISVNNQVMADILRNVTYQVHNKANIKVYAEKRIIELRYFET